jgi:peptidoglycan/LPS O-acetylase OafA/YrhL
MTTSIPAMSAALPNEAPAQPAARSGYMPQLDSVRGLAIIAVIIWHFENWSIQYVAWGPIGVRLFFVLGAFLVTGSLLRARDQVTAGRQTVGVAVRAFFTGRAIRIMPVYYLVILIGFALAVPSVREPLVWHLLFATNLYIGVHQTMPQETAHFWFLGAQEQFYLLWPFLVLLLPRRALIPASVGLIALALGARIAIVLGAANMFWYFASPLSNLDAIGLGALIAMLRHDNRDAVLARLTTRGTGWVALALFLIGGVVTQFLYGSVIGTLCDLALSLSFAWLVIGAARGFQGIGGALLNAQPLRDTGVISYGLYIVHPFMLPVVAWLGVKGYSGTVLAAAVAFLLASLSWHFIEKPIVALKAKRTR